MSIAIDREQLQLEIGQAQQDVAMAEQRWNDADPDFRDAALLSLRGAEERLRMLLVQATDHQKQEFPLKWVDPDGFELRLRNRSDGPDAA